MQNTADLYAWTACFTYMNLTSILRNQGKGSKDKHFLCKIEDLSLAPWHSHKSLACMVTNLKRQSSGCRNRSYWE